MVSSRQDTDLTTSIFGDYLVIQISKIKNRNFGVGADIIDNNIMITNNKDNRETDTNQFFDSV